MKAIYSIIAAAALACTEPVHAGINDPEVIIYRFPGVRDDGGAIDVGTATVFHCTNFSGTLETLRFVTRSAGGILLKNSTIALGHLNTGSVSTHGVRAYATDQDFLITVEQGTTAIAATSTNIICTAMTIDASASTPIGVALRGIRFSPIPGSQE
jgi:hypothetical protein